MGIQSTDARHASLHAIIRTLANAYAEAEPEGSIPSVEVIVITGDDGRCRVTVGAWDSKDKLYTPVIGVQAVDEYGALYAAVTYMLEDTSAVAARFSKAVASAAVLLNEVVAVTRDGKGEPS